MSKEYVDDRHAINKVNDDEQIVLGIWNLLGLWIQSLTMSGPTERYLQTRR